MNIINYIFLLIPSIYLFRDDCSRSPIETCSMNTVHRVHRVTENTALSFNKSAVCGTYSYYMGRRALYYSCCT